jgi:hypothetical protein
VGCCEHVNEPEDSVKDGEFLDMLNDYQFLKDSAALRCCVIASNLKYPVVMGAGGGRGRQTSHVPLLDLKKKSNLKKEGYVPYINIKIKILF